MYMRRPNDARGPWTDDAVLRAYRFTNAYRAADRASQYLIREVLYRDDRSQAPAEVFFRALFFKLFNKIDTWRYVERAPGSANFRRRSASAGFQKFLAQCRTAGERVYSAAYIMPPPALGHIRKHDNHLALLARMMDDGLPAQLGKARSLRAAYELIKAVSGTRNPFLAFQYVIDLD